MNRRQFLYSTLTPLAKAAPAPRPNIILILADDLGYSDIGCYGGEIRTPNLDALAKGGVRFTQLYNGARCCPSRAALMTGLYPHQVGMGNMTGGNRPPEFEGYQGKLNSKCVTIPQLLRDAGYATMMAGKWHLGQPGPHQRGFDDFFGMVHGFDSFWKPEAYTRLPAGRPQRSYAPGKFYATDAITDHALDFVQGARTSKKPYFLYLAYNAPHFPLHAPKDVIDSYTKVYEQGWDVIRQTRYERMQGMGLIDKRWPLTPRATIPANRFADVTKWSEKQNPAWDTLDADRKKDLARRMATFAAMADIMDRNIGRVVEDLKRNNELDNTLILFLSDNGACAEWDPFGFDVNSGPQNVLHKGAELDKMGQPGTYHSYGSAWAHAGNTPFRLFKHYNHEGGISTPFIVHWPAGLKRRNAIDHQPAHLIDIMPTLLELGGAKYPAATTGIAPMEGKSLVPAFSGKRVSREALYFEHEGNRAIRSGKWKLTAIGPKGPWELYDIDADRTEMNNLAAQHPQRVATMSRQWETWARRTKVLPWIWNPQYDGSQ